eukprot:m.240089 g.240089  ORF g.240089 m.240089 type:complete len:598 (-) comp14492_c0_seq1:156-1949(-)
MPTVGVNRDDLYERLGDSYSVKEFEDLCFDFGLELDEVTSEKEELEKASLNAKAKDASEDVIYKIDIPANRYDLLCIEGISRGIRVFQGKETCPKFVAKQGEHKMTITANTAQVRPFGVAAVLRGVKFDQKTYNSFIDLQDKLHQNICRRRSLVAIGTHDLSKIQGPFVYDAQAPKDIVFKPLRTPDEEKYPMKEYSAEELMTIYKEDMQLKQYLHIIEDKPVYPVIRDANGVVLSLPPIINGHHSRITTETTDVFIECTATDLTKAKIVLNIMCTMLNAKEIESVEVVQADGTSVSFPDLNYREEVVSANDIYKRMGLKREQASPGDLAELLTKMQLSATLAEDGDTLNVTIPPTRPDILHACDIWEDAAVAFGFNNIEWTQPQVTTAGKQLPINKLTEQLRVLISQGGFSEALTFALCKADDNFKNLRRVDDGKTACVIANPKTQDFQVGRCNLLSGILKTLNHNSSMPLPIQLFEIQDVLLLDSSVDTGARNERRLVAAHAGKGAAFQEVQGLLDLVMKKLDVPFSKKGIQEGEHAYTLLPSQDPAFFGQLGAADIIYGGRRVGVIGVVHPEVHKNYGLSTIVTAMEITIEPFL